MVALETAPKVVDPPELTSSTVVAPPVRPETLSRAGRRRAARVARRRTVRAVAVVTLLIVVAFAPALAAFGEVHPYPVGPGLVAPLMAIVLALVLTRWRKSEPPIHDRHLDWIIGVPLLLCAAAMMWWLPLRLSMEFWEHRLDLIAFPLFVAGAIGVLFGTRILWRLLPALVLLTLACPWLWGGPGAVVAVLITIAFLALRSRAPRAPRVRTGGSATGRHGGLATAHPAAAVILVAVAAGVVMWGTGRASGHDSFVDPLGRARTSEIGTRVAIASGFRFPVPAEAELTRRAFGPRARWVRSGALEAPGLRLDLVTAPTSEGLSALPIRDGHIAPRATTLREWRVRLGHGLSGLAVEGRQHRLQRRWISVTGLLPVRTADGDAVQRFTVQRMISGAPHESVDQVVSSASALVRAAAREPRQ